ncbi:MAG: hypothetical protein JNJ52_06050 [Flavobacterium sp.]|nr:hypothetical protein [Flavobacterium sp.]
MKKLILLIAFTVLATLSSCTADELPTKEEKNSTAQTSNELNKDSEPPIIIVIKP